MGVKIREKDPGEWYVYINHRGRRKAKRIGADKSLAKRVARNIEAQILLGDLDIETFNHKSPTFKAYAEMWLLLPNERSPRTNQTYSQQLRKHALPHLGNREISSLRRKDVKLMFDTLSASMRQNSLNNLSTTEYDLSARLGK